jgi:curved DNA-binding protein CbpA
MNLYELLEIDENDFNMDILKKQYHKMCKIHHPDKGGDGHHFKLIQEAYETLSDDKKRAMYDNYKRFSFLKGYNFTDEELQEMNKYYEELLQNENVRLATTLYKTLPPQVKQRLNSMKDFIFNYDKNKAEEISKSIVVPAKFIDITGLNEDFYIEVNVGLEDAYKRVLKRIIIKSKYGIYYLFLRDFNHNVYLYNKYSFVLKLRTKDDENFIRKGNDLIMKYKPKIHELFNHTILDIVLPDKKQLLLNIYDLKSKELIFVNKKGFNGGRLIILNICIEKF